MQYLFSLILRFVIEIRSWLPYRHTMPRYYSNDQLREKVRQMVDYDNTQKAIAARLGVSGVYLSDFLNGRRAAGPKILSGLGYEIEPFYREAEKGKTDG